MRDWAGRDASEAGERRWRSVLERFAVAGVECQPGALEAGLVLELLRPTLQLIRRGACLIRRCTGQQRNLRRISSGFDPSLQPIFEVSKTCFETSRDRNVAAVFRRDCGRWRRQRGRWATPRTPRCGRDGGRKSFMESTPREPARPKETSKFKADRKVVDMVRKPSLRFCCLRSG